MKWHSKKNQIPDFNCSRILNSCRFCGFQCIAIQQLSGALFFCMAIFYATWIVGYTHPMVISIVISTTPPKVREKNTTSVSNFMNWRSDELNFRWCFFGGILAQQIGGSYCCLVVLGLSATGIFFIGSSWHRLKTTKRVHNQEVLGSNQPER